MRKLKSPIVTNKREIQNPELIKQIRSAVNDLHFCMEANIPVSERHGMDAKVIGYGVNKIQRDIAADAVIAIAKQIKGLKGW